MTGEVILKEPHHSLSSVQQKSTFKARTAADVCTRIQCYLHTRAHAILPVKSLLTGRV